MNICILCDKKTFKINYYYAKFNNYNIKCYNINNCFDIILKNVSNFDYIVYLNNDIFFYHDSPKIDNIINSFRNKHIISSGSRELYELELEDSLNDSDIRNHILIVKNTEYNIELFSDLIKNNEKNMVNYYVNNKFNLQNNLFILPYNILQHMNNKEPFYYKMYELKDKPFAFNLIKYNDNEKINIINTYIQNYINNYDIKYIIKIFNKYNKIWNDEMFNKGYFPIQITNEKPSNEIYKQYIYNLDDNISYIKIDEDNLKLEGNKQEILIHLNKT